MKKLFVILACVCLLGSISLAQGPPARDLVASLAQLPGLAETPDKGSYVDLVKAIDEVYPGNIKIVVVPFPRSVDNVLTGQADFHIPLVVSPVIPVEKLSYAYVSEKLGSAAFVIYSRKDNPITKKMIEDALAKGGKFPYTIDVGAGQEIIYPFKGESTLTAMQVMQKVANQRADAGIWAQETGDDALKDLKLKNIQRELWGTFVDAPMIQKGPKGAEVNKILSDCIKKLKESGRLQELYKKIHTPYIDWQP